MNYTINNNFCDSETAKDIIDFCLKFGEPFSYAPSEHWDCKRIFDDKFKTKIINLLINNYKTGVFKLWFDYSTFNLKNFAISMTSYYNGRYLNLHKDTNSELTFIIILSDGYEGGEFALSNGVSPSIHFENLNEIKTFNLKLGDVISFNGSTTYHGVLPVTRGIRYALNIWMTESDFNYPKIKNNKTLL